MYGFVCKVANSTLKDMDLFLVCPQCKHSFESTSTQLIQHGGRVECPSCSHAFDGYVHYSFDDLDAAPTANKDTPEGERASDEDRQDLNGFRSHNFDPVVAVQRPKLQVGEDKLIRVTNNANLYEAVFAPMPEKKSIWRFINIVLGTIFVVMMIVNFNKQISTHIPKSADWIYQVCERISCEVGGIRRISELRLVGADLVMRSDVGKRIYQFRATIQNVGVEQIELPAIELTLTNSQGRVITSRVIYPIEYGGGAQLELGTKMEYQLNLLLRVDGIPPAAFDSYLFYPQENKA